MTIVTRLVALFLLLVLSPLLLLVALIISVDSSGGVLFMTSRAGIGGLPFNIYKFRTMSAGSESKGDITMPGDSRVTRIGSILRVTKIDELPQLINIARGEMALIGPRPEARSIVENVYTERQKTTLLRPPGLVGLGSLFNYVFGDLILERYDYDNVLLPIKLELDIVEETLIKERPLLYRFTLVWRTAVQIMRFGGSDSDIASFPEVQSIRMLRLCDIGNHDSLELTVGCVLDSL